MLLETRTALRKEEKKGSGGPSHAERALRGSESRGREEIEEENEWKQPC